MVNLNSITHILTIGNTVYGYAFDNRRVLVYKKAGKGTKVVRVQTKEFMELLARKNLVLDR